MTRIFADSFYFFALLNPRDSAHTNAMDFSRRNRGPLATTAWVLTELADGLASTPHRQTFRQVLQDIEANRANLIVPANAETFEKGGRILSCPTGQAVVANGLYLLCRHVGGGNYGGPDRRPSF